MTDAPTLELPDRPGGSASHDDSGTVPPPIPPGEADAWYAPDVRAQYSLGPETVATIRETDEGFQYRVREPSLSEADEATLEAVRSHFAGANLRLPRTREATVSRMRSGIGEKYERVLDHLLPGSAATRRRLRYHARRDVGCLGDLTPLALDDHIEVADPSGDRLAVHTTDYAPATTDLASSVAHLDRFASERLATHTVDFRGFAVPVVLYRENLIGSDVFATKYAVLEPGLLPGDEALIQACKDRIWETNVSTVVDDSAAVVREQAERFLSRQLTAANAGAWLDATSHRVRDALADAGLGVPPVDGRYDEARLADLVYYVLRDYVGQGQLTVPIRDPFLEDIEANRVGERVKVVPRTALGHDGRVPTNLVFEEEAAFVNVVTQLAAADGVELNASNPSAKVNLQPSEVDDDVTIRCAVALPVISEDGPHISIRKQAPDALTPVDLVSGGSLTADLVTLLWMLYEHHGVVLFAGPTGVGKTTLMNAHMPFVAYDDRPISIDEGSREVRLPHETGISLTTRDHEDEFKAVTMADLMTEANYLNPDVEVIAEINTPASFATFAESLSTGHGLLGTVHAQSVEKLVNRVVEQGLPPYLLRELDLVVFPRHVDGERYVGEAIEFVTEAEYEQCRGRCGVVEKTGTAVYWNSVFERTVEGGFEFGYRDPDLHDGDDERADLCTFDALADRTDRPVGEVEDEFHRKHRYVQYLVRAGIDDFDELFGFLCDLQTDEAATVERIRARREA
ncbi:type II/IV secretion system ATPase subunit [Haloarchaeobius amylolyticus]|uniref:type II/IV secretion system ATPase subunit n=1 Tax=Haloarchaeobius amylolyticus TaxID=1198296 RepID=UPI00226DFC35|nr:type II/IV secretion system ATPase subunit [Haloarchaeobius amylolyticus]